MTSRQPLVYIILVNWNKWQHTVECITSLLPLIYVNYKIIVVDNASTDGSVKYIRDACPAVTVLINAKNRGFSGGNNVGINLALEQGADYVWLLNNDTVVDPDALSELIRKAELDMRYAVVGSALFDYYAPHKLQTIGGIRIKGWSGAFGVPRRSDDEPMDYVTGASMLIRTDAIKNIGCLDESYFFYWEDREFCYRAKLGGYKLASTSGSKVYHKEGVSHTKDNGVYSSFVEYNMTKGLVQCFLTYQGLRAAKPILARLAYRIIGNIKRKKFRNLLVICAAVHDGLHDVWKKKAPKICY